MGFPKASASVNNTNYSSSTNQTQTVTPTNPAWVTGGLAGIGQNLTNLQGQDPYSFVANANPLLTQAGAGASGLGANTPGALAQFYTGMNGSTGVMNSLVNNPAPQMDPSQIAHTTRVSDLLAANMNPNLQSVVNPSLAAFDYGAGQNLAQNALTQAGTDSAFGGSGAALAAAATNAQNTLGRGQLAGQLYGNAFDAGQRGAIADAGNIEQTRLSNSANRQQAALINAQLWDSAKSRALLAGQSMAQNAGNLLNGFLTADGQNINDVNAQAGVGGVLQGIDQAKAQAPLSFNSDLASIWGGLPLNLLHGQTGTLNSNTKGSQTSEGLSVGFGG